MQHSEMGRLKNPHNGPYSLLHICSITKAPALVRLPKSTWIRISWVILKNYLPSFSETNWFYIQSLGVGGAKTKTKTPYPLAFLLLKESVRRMARRLPHPSRAAETAQGQGSPALETSAPLQGPRARLVGFHVLPVPAPWERKCLTMPRFDL